MIDYFLIISFLAYLAFFSIKSYKQVSSINAFSLGRRKVSTAALGATITATWISGSGFTLKLNEFYKEGFSFFIASIGMSIGMVILALWIVPKMHRFLGKLSIASIMGEEYGQTVRIITAILGCIAASGKVYIQFKIMGTVLYYMLPSLNEPICIVISSAIVIFYSFSGGVDAVVHTDKIQAVCFALSLVIGVVLLNTIIKYETPSHNLGDHFYPSHLLTLDTGQQIDLFFLCGYFLIPSMSPQTVQRVSMGINLNQVKKAYLWSSLALTAFLFAVCYFAWLLFQINPHIAPNKILLTLLDLFTFDGTKAILVIGIISMCMSTADSNLNIAAVLIANDTYKLNTFDKFQKLYFARGMTIIIGLLSLLFCFKEGSLLDIIIFAHTFYMPIIVPPFLAATFGFKTTERCALITMGVTFVFVVIFKFILKYKFNIIAPAMLFNLIILATSHYLIEKWEVLKCFGITSKLKEAKNA